MSTRTEFPAIGPLRLRHQLVSGGRAATPRDVVAHLGAVQAQDAYGGLWAVGLRMKSGDEAAVERAIEERSIVRTWPLRGTLHFVAAEDVRWMLALTAHRTLRRNAARHEREAGITPAVLKRSRETLEDALAGGRRLTRPELYAAMKKRRIPTDDSAGLRILWHHAHEGLIVFGPRRGKQPTFVLLDEWLPPAAPVSEDDAVVELAKRYFTSHGPATVADFQWWSGLPLALINKALPRTGLVQTQTFWFGPSEARPPRKGVFLLPPFDEITVGYRDRSAMIAPQFARRVNAGGGMLQAVVVIDGLVAGTWKRERSEEHVAIAVSPFRTLTREETRRLEAECERYSKFLGVGAWTLTT